MVPHNTTVSSYVSLVISRISSKLAFLCKLRVLRSTARTIIRLDVVRVIYDIGGKY